MGLQAGFRLVEPKSLQLGERGGYALSILNKTTANCENPIDLCPSVMSHSTLSRSTLSS